LPSQPKDDYAELIDLARDFARRELQPEVDALDESEQPLAGVFPKLGGLDLLGITVDEADGGAGLGAVAVAAVIEELAYVDPGTASATSPNSILFVA